MVVSKESLAKHWQILVTAVTVLFVIVGVVVWIIVGHSQQKSTAPPPHQSTSKPLAVTASGQPVPAEWQAKAKKLGYYCPSWAAKPGEIVSGICLPIDK